MGKKINALPMLACLILLLPLQARAATHDTGIDWGQIIAFAFIGLVIGAVIAFFNNRRR